MSFMLAKNKQRGFTIVELLIVIVVIAILAAISIVAYSGIQKRAQYSNIANLANSGLKALKLYKAQYGEYPSESSACFGSGYKNMLGSSEVDCYWDTTSGNTIGKNTAFDAKLKEFISVQPTISEFEARLYERWNYAGAMYENNNYRTLDGDPQRHWFWYPIPDKDGVCPVGNVVLEGYPDSTTADVDNSYQMTVGARCRVALK